MDPQLVVRSPCSKLATALAMVIANPDDSESLHKLLGTYCHQSRNLLHTMKLSLFLAQRSSPSAESEKWGALERDYLAVEHFFDRLQVVCRPMAVSPVRMSLSLLIEDRLDDWSKWFAGRGRCLEVIAPDGPAVGDYDPARMAQGLDAFVAWRVDSGRGGESATLRWGVDDRHFHLEWNEPDADGRDLPEERLHPPERLALPLLTRVMSAHAGALEFAVQDGLRLRLRWPRHVRPL